MAATIDVNPANQAFPPPPPDSQAIPTPFGVAVQATPAVPSAFTPPSSSIGTSLPALPDFFVATQNNVFSPAQDVIVTENGNYATNNNSADVQTFKISSITYQGASPPDANSVYIIVMTGPTGQAITLSSYGVDFTQLFATFPASYYRPTPPAIPSPDVSIPSRQIVAFNDPNTIVIAALDSVGNAFSAPPGQPAPVAGDLFTIGIVRQGPSLTVQSSFSEIDVFANPTPQPAATVPSVGTTFLGNIFPNNPGLPFIGGGQSGPKFIGDLTASSPFPPFVPSGQVGPPFLGTFEVENQALYGKGLPVNVFV